MQFQAYTLQKDPSWAAVYLTAPSIEQHNPVHLCILLDVSWPMDDNNKLDSIILSIQMLLELLGPRDRISLITFSNHATIILNYVDIIPEKRDILRQRISVIQTDDVINISAAILRAQEVLQKDSSMKQSIILITGGHATFGIYDTKTLLSMTRQLLTDFPGTSLSTIAYGLQHDKDLLQGMATQGSGSYSTITCWQEISVVFGNIIGSLFSCIAQDVRVILPKNVALRSRYPIIETTTDMEIMIGDIPAEMEAVFFVQLPRGTPLQLKGYDLTAHDSFDTITTIIDRYNDDIHRNNDSHSLRFQAVHLIDEVALSAHWSNTLRNTKKIEIKHILDNIHNYRSMKPRYVWELIIHELKECMYFLDRPYLQFHTNDLYRNICVLGQQRGIPSVYVHEGHPSSLKSPYSNSIQRYLSAQILKNMIDIHVDNQIKVKEIPNIQSHGLLPPFLLRHHTIRFEGRTIIEYVDMSIVDIIHASR